MTEKRGGARHHNRPYHNKSSYHPYRSGSNNNRFSHGHSASLTNRLVSVNEAIKTDRILSIESFANIERINDLDRASYEYSVYVKKHQKAHLRTIFNNHKKEKWIINSKDEADKRSLFDAINWTPEINLKYQESFNMKLEESSTNDGNSTETRLLPFDNDSELPESFASLLSEFSQQVITMSNIPPYVDKEALEGHLKELSPQSEIEITSPNADKSFYRLAWLKTSSPTDKISELVPKFESLGSIEGAKIYFGLASSNFRRFKVTKYLQSSEEQLLNLAINLVKRFEKKEEEDFESLFSNSLDKAVIYLRKVHNFCFWCVTKFSCNQEMLSKCGDLHLTMTCDDNENEVKHDQHRLIEKLSALIDFLKNLNEISKETGTNLDDALTETSIKKVEEGKYRCNHCSKAFKGPEFVLKHLTLKHEDIVKQTQDDLVDFSKLVSNAQLWLFPTTMIPRYTSIRNKQANNHNTSRDSHGSSKSSLSKGSRASSKDYTDWDATSNINTSIEISYDL